MKKLTITDMQIRASYKGGQCLSKEFKGRDVELTWKCAKGHVFDLRPRFLVRGAWCPQCAYHDTKVRSLELMQEWAEARGGKCLSEVYINNTSPLLWECKNGHRFRKTRDDVKQQKEWCAACTLDKIREKRLKEIQRKAEMKGGTCLTNTYSDLNTRIKLQCALGHTWETIARTFIYNDSWCPHCYGNALLGIEKMKELAASNNGKCLSIVYKGNAYPLKWQCAEGHIWKTSPQNIKAGYWCRICALNKEKRKHLH